jgi:hypothetical protein
MAQRQSPRTLIQTQLGSDGRDDIGLTHHEMVSNTRMGIDGIEKALNTNGALRENTEQDRAVSALVRQTLTTLKKSFEENESNVNVVGELCQRMQKSKALVNTKLFVGQVSEYYRARTEGRELRFERNVVSDMLEVFDLFGTEFYRSFPESVSGAHQTRAVIPHPTQQFTSDTSLNTMRQERARDRGRRVTQIAFPLFDRLAKVNSGMTPSKEVLEKLTLDEWRHVTKMATLVGLRFKRRLSERLTDVMKADNTRVVLDDTEKSSDDGLTERGRFVSDNIEQLVLLSKSDSETIGIAIDEMHVSRAEAEFMARHAKWGALTREQQEVKIQGIARDAYIDKLDTLDRGLQGLTDSVNERWKIFSDNGGSIRFPNLMNHIIAYYENEKKGVDLPSGSNFVKTFGGYLGTSIPKTEDGLDKAIAEEFEKRTEVAVESVDEPYTDPDTEAYLRQSRANALEARKAFSNVMRSYVIPVHSIFNLVDRKRLELTDPMIGVLIKSEEYMAGKIETLGHRLSFLASIQDKHNAATEGSPDKLDTRSRDNLYIAYNAIRGVLIDINAEHESLKNILGRLDVHDRYAAAAADVSKMSLAKAMQNATGPLEFKTDGTFESELFAFCDQVDLFAAGKNSLTPGIKQFYIPYVERLAGVREAVEGILNAPADTQEKKRNNMRVGLTKLRGDFEQVKQVVGLLHSLQKGLEQNPETGEGGVLNKRGKAYMRGLLMKQKNIDTLSQGLIDAGVVITN